MSVSDYGGESGEAEFGCVLFDYMPDYPFRDSVTSVPAGLCHDALITYNCW